MTVYLVQQPFNARDFSSAARYGPLEIIFDDPRYQPSLKAGIASQEIRKALQNFNPAEDYVMVSGGDPLGILLTGQVLGNMFPRETLQALRWERERSIDGQRQPNGGFYMPVRLKP